MSVNIQIALSNQYFFSNASNNDVVIYTTTPSQNILIGTSNSTSALLINSNNISVANNINFGGILLNNGIPYVGTQWSNNGANIYIVTSNVGVGKSNPTFPLDVTGDLNFTGTLRQSGIPYIGGAFATNSSNVFLFGSNLGLNKSNPTATLDILGTLNISSNVFIGGVLTVSNVEYITSNITVYNSETIQSNLTVYGITTVASNIMPLSNYMYDIGSSNMRFNSIYLNSNTIDLATVKIHADSATGGLKITDSNNSNTTLIVNKIQLGTSSNAVTINLDSSNNISFSSVTLSNGFTVSSSNTTVAGGWSNNSSNVFIIGSNIGIGKSNPQSALDVNGNILINGSLSMQGVQILGNIGGAANVGNSVIQGFCNTSLGVIFSISCNVSNNYFQFTACNSNLLTITGNGNLGIGFSNPNSLLSVAGGTTVGVSYSNAIAPNNGLIVQGILGIGTSNPGYTIDVNGDINFSGNLRKNGVLYQGSQWSNNGSNLFIFNSNIGIGTSNPGSFLSVAGGVTIGAAYSNVTTPSNSLIVQSNIGIGTSNPAYNLDVAGNINFTGNLTQNGVAFTSGGGSTTVNTSNQVLISDASNVNLLFNTALNGAATGVSWRSYMAAKGGNTTIVTDCNGNIYTTGLYTSPSNISIYDSNGLISPTIFLRSNTNNSAYVIKYNSNGVSQWIVNMDGGSAGGIANTGGLAVDSNGFVYVAGYFNGAGTKSVYNANNIVSSTVSLTKIGCNNQLGFLIQFNSNGVAQWASTAQPNINGGGGGIAFGNYPGNVIAIGGSNIYVAGTSTYSGSYFGNMTINLYNPNNVLSSVTIPTTIAYGTGGFLVSYNTSGIAQWCASVDINATTAASNGETGANGVTADINGNAYLCGQTMDVNFLNSAGIGSNFIVYNAGYSLSSVYIKGSGSNSQSSSAYIVKFNASGIAQYSLSFLAGGASGVYGYSAGVDSNLNVYMCGQYIGQSNNIVYNAGASSSGFSFRNSTSTAANAFLTKFNSNGVLHWGVSADTTGTTAANSFALDNSNNVYLTGNYGGSTLMTIYNVGNSASSINLRQPTSAHAGFLIQFNSNGNAQAAYSIDNIISNGYSSHYGVAWSSTGNIYLTGFYSNTVNIYNSNNVVSSLTLPALNSAGAYLIAYSLGGGVSYPTYNLLSCLGTSNNGLTKNLVNISSTPATVNISNSNNTSTIQTITVPVSQSYQLLWYGSNWYNVI
jgi:hypothetical protein